MRGVRPAAARAAAGRSRRHTSGRSWSTCSSTPPQAVALAAGRAAARPAWVAPDLAEQVSARDAVLGALRQLSPRQRACVVLRFYEDLPVAGIARALGLGEGTVKRYLSEGTALLAGHLSGTEAENADER